MASIKIENIKSVRTSVEVVDLRSIPQTPAPQPDPDVLSIRKYHPGLDAVVGPRPTHSLLLSSAAASRSPFFRGGCAYVPAAGRDGELLYATSGPLPPAANAGAQLPTVLISRVALTRGAGAGGRDGGGADDDREGAAAVTAVEWQKLRSPPSMPNPAGVAVCRASAGPGNKKSGTVYFCSQGALSPPGVITGGLFRMERGRPPVALVTHWGGRPFNSPQQVAVQPPIQRNQGDREEGGEDEGCLWFTDSAVGFEAEIRRRPTLPGHIYRYDTATGVLRVMADGLERPCGIALSPDGGTLYVSDTEAQSSKGGDPEDLTRPATIYAFDVIMRHGQPFLAQKRVFAYALSGVPAVLACDNLVGNVYAACGDGVEIWSPGGEPLGLIVVPVINNGGDGGGGIFGGGVFRVGGGKVKGEEEHCCSTLCFGQYPGELFVGAGQRLWKVDLDTPRKGQGEVEMELI